MEYHITIRGFDSGLNEVLNGVQYVPKIRRIVNHVKDKNDNLIIRNLRFDPVLRDAKIQLPIVIHYKFYCKDRRRDRMNVASAFDKSFEDALQKVGYIPNDGFSDVLGMTSDFEVDKEDPRVEIIIHEWNCSKGQPRFWGGWERYNL